MKTTSGTLRVLIVLIALISGLAASMGIFYQDGKGQYEFTSIQGKTIVISGEGLYKNMSADVAIQGKAQDVITLFIAIPVLLVLALIPFKNKLRRSLILAGTIAYFLVTYFFYLNMGAYNIMFLAYAALAGLSFFAFYIAIKEVNKIELYDKLKKSKPALPGWVLMVIPVMIALLWLNIVLTPLFNGTVYPDALQHYTTLVVQGNDLGLALPISFVVGLLYFRNNDEGILYAPVYLVFLCFLMLALIAKIIGMSTTGVPVGPPLVIIPIIWMISLASAISVLKKC